MAYSTLQPNQTVSFNNLQSGVIEGYFLARKSIPSGTKQITKAEAEDYVNVDTTYPSLAGKPFNQLVVKDNLQGITNIYPYTIYILANAGTGIRAWQSIDGGYSFNQLGLYPSDNWTEIAGNTAGTHIAVVDSNMSNYVHISNDSGVTFTAISLNGGTFYPYGVSMSTNGQFIAVSGFNIRPDGVNTGYAKVAVSSNYGASFTTAYTDSTLRPYGFNNFYQFYSTGRISVSSNGQSMTAIFSFGQYVGFPYFYTRPVGFTLNSNNFGASWALGNVTNYGIFQGIALSETGQYQVITADWYDGNNAGGVVTGIRVRVSNNYGAAFVIRSSGNFNTPTPGNFMNVGISANGKSIFTSNVYPTGNATAVYRFVSNNYGVNFDDFGADPYFTGFFGAAVGQTPISGITDSYVAAFTNYHPNYYTNIPTLWYSTDGGFFSNNFTATIASRTYTHVYNKALNTPESAPYSYVLYYSYSAGLPFVDGANSVLEACALSANGIIVYSSYSSITFGTPLYTDIYGLVQLQANPSSSESQDFYKIGDTSIQFSNNYIINSVISCNPFTTFYIDNSSLDIIITNVTVDGNSLSNISGSGFPVYAGSNITGEYAQGTFDVIIYYSASNSGQRIETNDSNLNFTCTNASTGSNSITLSGAAVGGGAFQIYAYDGTC
jgi:hypothetical protein